MHENVMNPLTSTKLEPSWPVIIFPAPRGVHTVADAVFFFFFFFFPTHVRCAFLFYGRCLSSYFIRGATMRVARDFPYVPRSKAQ